MRAYIRFATACVLLAWLGIAWSQTPAAPANYQGLWWNAPAQSESGWGINFAHQGDVIFATWFTYDTTGKAWWLSMTAEKTSGSSYAGTIYQTTGPAFNALQFDSAKVKTTAIGAGTLTFSDASHGSFTYTVNGVTQTKAITPQVFGQLPTCTFGVETNLALATNYQGLWWNAPAGSESGWGINFAHQGDVIFATWFTYGLDGTPLWLSATMPKTAAASYEGTVYQTTGPAFSAAPFDPTKVRATVVGSATLTFAHGNSGTFAYAVNGVSQTKQITRQVFRAPGTVCAARSIPRFHSAALAWFFYDKGMSDSEYFKYFDDMKALGYDTVTFATGVNVDLNTGQVLNTAVGDLDVSIGRFVDYVQSIGLKVNIQIQWVDSSSQGLNLWSPYGPGFSKDLFFQTAAPVLVDFARFSQRKNVALLYLGAENNTLDTREYRAKWQEMIAAVRANYTGFVTYDALFLTTSVEWGPAGHTADFRDVGFWDLLDAISVSFFPKLSATPIYDVAQINSLYFNNPAKVDYSLINEIVKVWRQYNKPFILAQVSFSTTDKALDADMAEYAAIGQAPNQTLQSVAWKSLMEVKNNNLHGVVMGLEVWGYSPWVMSRVLHNISDVYTQAAEVGLYLYHKPAEQTISFYMKKGWGYYEYTTTNGSVRDDIIYVGDLTNTINPNGGNDEIHGGKGMDTVVVNGPSTSCDVRYAAAPSLTLPQVTVTCGLDVMRMWDVEKVRFSDTTIDIPQPTSVQ